MTKDPIAPVPAPNIPPKNSLLTREIEEAIREEAALREVAASSQHNNSRPSRWRLSDVDHKAKNTLDTVGSTLSLPLVPRDSRKPLLEKSSQEVEQPEQRLLSSEIIVADSNSSRSPSDARAPSRVRGSWQPSWHMKLMPDALDRLGEHPRFDYETAKRGVGRDVASTQEILLSHSVVEEDREPLYRLELLRMFRQRLRLVALLGILLLPIFHLFYSFLSPLTARQAIFPHGLMLAVCVVYLFVSPHISNLMWARQMSVAGYALICTGASLVMSIVSQSPVDDTVAHSVQFVVLAAHSQILLSVVLLPLTLWESAVMTAIVTCSLIWSAWWVLPDPSGPARSAQIFVLATTAVFVLCVAHFQSLLRRRAFDSSFDLARSAVQLQALSTLDAVTGGFNRLYLEKTLALEVSRAARFGHPVSVMMFDLDNFKAVNDTNGHASGDEVLRAIGEAASLAVRDVDTVARFGGDEFMVVLPETEIDDARAIAERLQESTLQRLQEQFGANTPEGKVTLSIGIVTLHPVEPIPVAQLVALADERLYEAKHAGKNRIAF